MRPALAAALLAGGLAMAGTADTADTVGAAGTGRTASADGPAREARACRADPLAGRALHLRGSFNAWAADDERRFAWSCDRWELVTALAGDHAFKIADEAWSADADFGAGPGEVLVARGRELRRRFDGTHRFVLAPGAGGPTLRIDACPPPPLGDRVLYLRGTMNGGAARTAFALRHHCDAYVLNVRLQGRHAFRIAEAGAHPAHRYGDDAAPFVRRFEGEQTLRVRLDGGTARLELGPRDFVDPTATPAIDPVARSLRFDSRAAAHKRPFGAVPAGSEIAYEVRSRPGVRRLTLVIERRTLEGNQERLDYAEVARLPMTRRDAGPGQTRWQARHRFADVGVHGYWFEAEVGGRRYALQNNAGPLPWTREKGRGGAAVVAPMPASTASIRRFRQTVYRPDFTVPGWAPDIVYYQVFPDRFRNGDPGNDPQPGRDRYQSHAVERHARWNERPYKPGSGDGSDAVHNNDFFGGDLQGIVDKLDEIAELGVNTLYLTPVNRAPSNHKYDTADYRHVDPAFGRDEDFARLAREAARRGLRVIPDTSFNHVGSDSVYFDRYANFRSGGAFEGGRVRPDSSYAGWFRFDPSPAEPGQPYGGWSGVADLPEIDKSSPDFRRFAYGAPDGITQLWLDRGAAGWRMDVAPWVPDDFWREWRQAVKARRPDALTIAETWFDASKHLLGDMFDSTMNYVFRNAVLDYAAGGKGGELVSTLEHLREAYPPQALFAQMNLISSHDVPRALHVLGWHADPGDPPATGEQVALARQRLRLAVLMQMTYPGAPSVYYGDEVGLTGGNDPYNRAPYPWADLGGQPDLALRAEFRRLIALRRQHEVLRRGSLEAPLHADEHVVVFARRLGAQWALVAWNNAGHEREVRVPLAAGAPARWHDALGTVTHAAPGAATHAAPSAATHAAPGAATHDAPGAATHEARRGAITLRVPPRFGLVLRGE